METEEYNPTLKTEKKGLNYKLLRNISMGGYGLIISGLLLASNAARVMDLKEQAKSEIALSPRIIKDDYIKPMDKIKYIKKAARGIGSISIAGLILGAGIPYVNYHKKKKSLEQSFKK